MEAPPPYSENDPSTPTRPLANSNDAVAATPNGNRSGHQHSVDSIAVLPDTQRGDTTHDHNEYEHIASSAAAAYFESRPASDVASTVPTTHGIAVNTRTHPSELAYPADLQVHDVHQADWLTFLNFLLPEHVLHGSAAQERRTSQEELVDGVNSLEVDEKRAPQEFAANGDIQEDERRLRATLQVWNQGFFNPRGLHIVLTEGTPDVVIAQATTQEAPSSRMPGTWIPYDHEIIGESSAAGRRRGFFRGFQTSSGFRVGPLVADNDGFRMGNLFKADQRGVRLGGSRGFVADDNGVSMGGKSVFRREPGDHERDRGAPHTRARKPNRSASLSSTTSESSMISLRSDSSCGSLPEYDDIESHQLLLAKDAIFELLYHTDQPMTKEEVAHVRLRIEQQAEPYIEHPEPEVVVLRKEVKDLLKAFRERKRTEKVERRRAERERRVLRSVERKERREGKGKANSQLREVRDARVRLQKRQPWNASRIALDLPNMQPPPLPRRPSLNHTLGSSPGRAASVPSLHSCVLDNITSPTLPTHTSPGPGSNSTWPRMPSPGAIDSPHNLQVPGSFPADTRSRSGSLYSQAHAMDELALSRHERAVFLRTEATSRDCSDFERAKRLKHASAVEEESQRYRLEAEMLRAEALDVDTSMRSRPVHHDRPSRSSHTLPIEHGCHWSGG